MKHKTSKLLSILLALVMMAGLLPLGQVAYAEGEITVTHGYNAIMHNAYSTWTEVSGASSYAVRLKNFDTETNSFRQANGTGTWIVTSNECTIGAANFQYSNYGSDRYRIEVEAMDAGNNTIATGYSDEFTTGFTQLEKPTVTLGSNGIVSWSSVSNATGYHIVLYPGEYQNVNNIASFDAGASDTTYDLSSYFYPGNTYHVTLYAYSSSPTVQDSEVVTSNAVTVPGTKNSITGIQWNGTTLDWDDFPGTTRYTLWLKKYNGSAFIQQGGTPHTSVSEYDFSTLLAQFGAGRYIVRIVAQKGNYNDISNETESAEIEYIASLYNVTVNNDGNGTASASPTSGPDGTVVTLTATPNPGYKFKEWVREAGTLSGGLDVPNATSATTTFTISGHDVIVKATFEEDTTATNYSVTVNNDGNGTASASPTSGTTGTEVTLTATPTSGYQFKEWQVVSGGVSVTDNKFTIGSENIEIKAIFEEIITGQYRYWFGVYNSRSEHGTVSVNGTDWVSAAGNNELAGYEYTAYAKPDGGYVFKEWQDQGGAVVSTEQTYTFTLEKDMRLYAIFEEDTSTVKPTITTSTLPGGKVGTAYNQTLAATGDATIAWTLDSGNLPAGLTLAADGKISGTPTAANTYTFTVKATNGAGSDTKSYTVTIAPADATTYTVSFNANSGGGTMADMTVIAGEKLTLPECTFTPPSADKEFDKWDAGKPGDKVDITADCTITAIWKNKPVTKTLSSIAITTPPTKTTYTAGQSFNKAGMVVTATYSDSTTAEVTGYTVSPSGALTTSNTSVTISYTEGGVTKTATQAITVNATTKTLDSIAITTPPTKTAYTAGESFDKAGMVVTATYSDSSTAPVTSYTVTPSGALKTTDTSVTISYTEGGVTKTATQAITVNAATKTLDSIAITTPPTKTTYTAGQSFDKAGMVVTATYSDSSTADVTSYTVSPSGALKTTDTSVTVSYTEGGVTKTATQAITVNSSGGSGGGGGGGITTKYTLTYNTGGGSTIAATKHNRGTTVNLTATPTKDGFTFDGWYADAALTSKITSIKMDGNKTVYAGWKETGSVTPGHDCPSKHLKDVDITQWYHEGVDYVVAKKLMQGIAADLFAPNATTTRAMIVTILYRLGGEPAVSGKSGFEDVEADTWYTNAVAWAEANDIVNGYDAKTFGPMDPITREQMAAIMFRYSKFKGYDVSKSADLSVFTDNVAVSDWAVPAMKWAVAEELFKGVGDNLISPTTSATRAQVATILMRYIENVK